MLNFNWEKRTSAHFKHLIQELNNNWFYPVLFAVAGNIVLLQCNSFTLILWIYSLLRLISTGKHRLIYVGFLCSFFIVILAVNLLMKETGEQDISKTVNEKILRIRPDKIQVDGDYLQVEGILDTGKGKLKVKGTSQLKSEKEKKFWLSQKNMVAAAVSGKLEIPTGRRNLNGFDYAAHLRHNQINQILRIEIFHNKKSINPSFFHLGEQLSVLRRRALLYCRKRLYPATAVYSQILLLGEKSDDDELSESFTTLGILHLFSLSGMHVAFFAGLLRYLLLRLGVSAETFFWVQLLLSVLFAGLAGFSVSVVRALLQKNLAEGNSRFQLQLSSLDIWSVSLLIAVLLNPFLLFTLAGQYSYFLSFSIIYLSKGLRSVSVSLLRQFLFSSMLSIFTIPILGMTTYEWQPIGIFLTFILVPFFEKLLLPSLTGGFILSFFVRESFFSQLLEMCLLQMNKVFLLVSEGQLFSVVIGKTPLLLFIVEMCLVFMILSCLNRSKYKAQILTVLLLLTVNQKYFLQSGIVAFIDVGQGDSIFIQAPLNGESILIDTGGRIGFQTEAWRAREKQKSPADYTVTPFLKSRGVKKLDKVFITHSDADHMGDLLAVSKKIEISSVYFGEGAERDSSFFQIIKEMKAKGTGVYRIKANENLSSEFDLKILSPIEAGTGSNNDSLVIYASINKKPFLFTGDLEEAGEKKIAATFPDMTVDILKVGHHGSKSSTSQAFLKAFSPKQAVISCGINNRFSHPHEETLKKLAEKNIQSFRTDRQGMVYCEWSFFLPNLQLKTVAGSD